MIETATPAENLYHELYDAHSLKAEILPFRLSDKNIEELIFAYRKPGQQEQARTIVHEVERLPYHVSRAQIHQLLAEVNGELGGDRSLFFGKKEILSLEKANGTFVFTGDRCEYQARREEMESNPDLYSAIMNYQA